MFVTIPEAIHWYQEQGLVMLLPTPPVCQQLLARAHADGIAVGRLYVVSYPLEPGFSGTLDPESGDLCAVYDASQGIEGERCLLQTVLLLLARIQQHFPGAQTIDEDWEQVRRSLEQAVVLARRWELEALFTEEEVQHLMAQALRLARAHRAAARLVGHSHPAIARQAYVLLQQRRAECSGLEDDEVFLHALEGSAPEELGDLVVDLNRALLRPRWIQTSPRPADVPASFQKLTIPPAPEQARLLRSLLSHLQYQQEARCVLPNQHERHFVLIRDAQDLLPLLGLLHPWLIELFPQAALRLTCWLYGSKVSGAPHLYRLYLRYEALPDEQSWPTRDLWVLFLEPGPLPRHLSEGAWQRFLRSWLSMSEVICADLTAGLQVLWEMLEGQV